MTTRRMNLPSVTPIMIETEVAADASDLRRADESQPQDGSDPERAARVARVARDLAVDQQAGQF